MATAHSPEARALEQAALEHTKLLVIRALILASIASARPGDVEAISAAKDARGTGMMFDLGRLVVARASTDPKETLLQHVRGGRETHIKAPPVNVVFREFSFSSRLPTEDQEPGVYVYPYWTVPGRKVEEQKLPAPNCPPGQLNYVRLLFSRAVVAGWELADEAAIEAHLTQRYVPQPGLSEKYSAPAPYLDLGRYISEARPANPGQV